MPKAKTDSKLTNEQQWICRKVFTTDREYLFIVTVRYDDACRNGHNTFSITGDIWRSANGRVVGRDLVYGGCIHTDIHQHFQELAHLTKWHLCSSDGPLHYIANTVYFAGDADYNGLRAGETRQLLDGKTKQPLWNMVIRDQDGQRRDSLPHSLTIAATVPSEQFTASWEPALIEGKGKERQLDLARLAAIWPDATDEDLIAPGLEDRLKARLPKLMAEFREVVESLGFTF